MPNAARYPASHYLGNGPALNGDFAYYDANLAASINGDDGSAHAPTSPIVLSGPGLQVSAPILIARTGVLNANRAPTIFCQDGDFIELGTNNPNSARSIAHPVIPFRGLPNYAWAARPDGCIQAYGPMVDMSDGKGMRAARALVRIRPHDGATLGQVSVFFRVGAAHPALPPTMPSVRIVRMAPDGTVVPLTSTASGADSNGFVFASKPSSATLWYAGGQTQSLIVPCDQNNAINVDAYTYYVELVEEQGLTGYPWQLTYKQPVVCTFASTISGLSGTPASGVADGLSLGVGDRVLLTENFNVNPQFSGIWIIQSGAWTRGPDMSVSSDFSQGMVVPVLGGTLFGGTLWQADPSATSWTIGPGGIASVANLRWNPRVPGPTTGNAFTPKGVIWTQLRALYTSIGSLQFS